MSATRPLPYPTRFTLAPPVGCFDRECWRRPCVSPGLDKGTYTPGRGYTSYHATPIPKCMTRHISGCPSAGSALGADGLRHSTLPEPDTENARCCPRPDYPKSGPAVRVCANCRKEAPARFARLLNALPPPA